MKKTLCMLMLIGIISTTSKAQTWSGNQNLNDAIYRNGNVSIGTATTPTEKLQIRGNMRFLGQNDYQIYGDIVSGRFGLYGNTNTSQGPFIELIGKNNPDHPGAVVLGTYGSTGEIKFCNYNQVNNSWSITARFLPNGKFIIGDVAPNGNYGLYVKNGILTDQVKVALSNTADWSDYVFAPDYKLMTLNQLETYIDENKHLPDVPSAEEVVDKGINLGQMDATLLKKIEELTLYTLELNKQVNALQEKIVNLESKK